MIELLGLRYGVGKRTAAATYCLTVTAGLSYSLFTARFTLPWFGLRSPAALRVLESGCLVFAMTSVLIATTIVWALVGATKKPVIPSTDEEEAPQPMPRSRLSSEATAWLEVAPMGLGFTVSVLIQGLQWLAGSLLFNALVCVIIIVMLSHVRSLWCAAQRLRSGDSERHVLDRDQLDASDEKRFLARFPDSRWKPPTAIGSAAEADEYARRARRSRNGLMTTAVGAMSFVTFIVLLTLGSSMQALAHDLGLADLQQFLETSFLQLFGIPTAAAMTLSLAGACQARASEMAALTELYDELSATLAQRAPS